MSGSGVRHSLRSKALYVPRCARCLESVRSDSKYCATCRRKVIGLRVLAVVVVLAAVLWTVSLFVGNEPPPPIWVR